jgi:hypothetical protein
MEETVCVEIIWLCSSSISTSIQSVASGADGLVVSLVSGSDEICCWWSVFDTFAGGSRVDYCSCVWCLALVHVDDGMRRRFSSSTMSSEDDVVGIW